MLHLRGALIGIAGCVGIVLGIVIATVYLGFAPMAADSVPSKLEVNLAMKAVHAVSEREMGKRDNPVPLTNANLTAGLQVYQHNCLICHGAADGRPSNIAQGFYVRSPQFATDGVEDDPEGATYWKIHHGIRFTAMPAFREGLTDVQMWQVVMFLKHMDHLPKDVDVVWKAAKSGVGPNSAAQKPMEMKR